MKLVKEITKALNLSEEAKTEKFLKSVVKELDRRIAANKREKAKLKVDFKNGLAVYHNEIEGAKESLEGAYLRTEGAHPDGYLYWIDNREKMLDEYIEKAEKLKETYEEEVEKIDEQIKALKERKAKILG